MKSFFPKIMIQHSNNKLRATNNKVRPQPKSTLHPKRSKHTYSRFLRTKKPLMKDITRIRTWTNTTGAVLLIKMSIVLSIWPLMVTICVKFFLFLVHQNKKASMQEFVRNTDWSHLEFLNLYGCKIDDDGWRVFVNNAHLFSSLKVLDICKILHLFQIWTRLAT